MPGRITHVKLSIVAFIVICCILFVYLTTALPKNISEEEQNILKSHQTSNTFTKKNNMGLEMDKVKILLFGYHGGGTNFVGQLLGYNEETFYFHEPLWSFSTDLHFYTKDSLCYINNYELCRFVGEHEVTKTINKIEAMFSCDESFFVNDELRERMKTFGYLPWTVTKGNIKTELQRKCIRRKNIVSTVVRLTGTAVAGMMYRAPNFKVVYLYRDPRALIHSRLVQRDWQKASLQTLRTMSISVCEKMLDDYVYIRHLADVFPDRVLIVQFQLIAKYPAAVTRHMFKYLNISTSANYIDLIENMDKNKEGSEEGWYTNIPFKCTECNDISGMKDDLSDEENAIIDKACKDVYGILSFE